MVDRGLIGCFGVGKGKVVGRVWGRWSYDFVDFCFDFFLGFYGCGR